MEDLESPVGDSRRRRSLKSSKIGDLEKMLTEHLEKFESKLKKRDIDYALLQAKHDRLQADFRQYQEQRNL